MTLFHLHNISLSYQGTPVLEDVSAFISEGTRTGIIGPNGSGKSSLVKIIVGEILPEKGHIDWVKMPRTGYVPQVFSATGQTNVSAGSKQVTPLSLMGPENSGYLGRFGIGKHLWDRPCSILSGGEKTRLSLAIAFSCNPDLLVLDEPTNHLDIAGIEWLEKMLTDFRGTILAVSHDRYFLSSVCNQIWRVEGRRVKAYSGNYSSYVATRKAEETHMLREYARWQDKVERLAKETQARRQWYDKAHKDAGQNDYLRARAKKHASQVKAKERKLETLLEQKPKRVMVSKQVSVGLMAGSYRTKTILRAEDLSFKYGENRRHIVKDARFRVSPGEKIALIGPNGCGKTTLIKLFAGDLAPSAGSLWVNPNIQVGYLTQMLDELDLSASAAENISRKTGRLLSESRNLLGYLGVSGDTQVLPLETLSMGERSRVALACLTFAPYDLLLLDEPTNHLDLIAREGIEEAMTAFPGTIIVATHDRFLIERFCTSVWYLDKGRLQIHQGSYRKYQEHREDHLDEKDRQAKELAVRTRLAYLVSRLGTTADPSEKAALEVEWDAAMKELQSVRNRGRNH